ncbi:hypothetical protein [Peteryoungia ipomoeae]|uniref:Uncharacterized protein n=1 Tax=Peteryoungia ipomoeae TaxID=1210932 RepID=A0A4S8NXN6_9HYPH|nr:hypothetical protein [Peteryoungia ipomoeae]THV19849.1 hypothetical protein FAA97_19925 [Peteryoungia ipomoeae]
MKFLSKLLTFSAAYLIGTIASANAADLTVNVSTGPTNNATSGTTWSIDSRTCTGCTASTTLSIPKNSTRTNTADATIGASEMTYTFSYYNYFGTSWQKKGCDFSVTLLLDGAGNVTGISSFDAIQKTGLSVCSGPAPSLSGAGQVIWNVYVNAS